VFFFVGNLCGISPSLWIVRVMEFVVRASLDCLLFLLYVSSDHYLLGYVFISIF